MSVVCVTKSVLPHLAGKIFLDKTKMGSKVVQTRSPGIGRSPVAASPLPGLAIKAVTGKGTDWNAIGTSKWRVHIDHIDLCVGITWVDTDVHVDLAAVVAVGQLKTVSTTRSTPFSDTSSKCRPVLFSQS